jgi:hypothetical protein
MFILIFYFLYFINSEYVLQARYPIAEGHGLLVKKAFLLETKNHINHKYKIDLNIGLKNNKEIIRNIYNLNNEEIINYDNDSFNIILIQPNNRKYLIATSNSLLNEYYCQYLQTGIDKRLRDECIKLIGNRVNMLLN